MLKNERLSLILATYQRNLELTEKKLVASQQENIDLHIQIKQLIQNSSKLQHQIKEISAAGRAGGGDGFGGAPELQVEKSPAALSDAATAAAAVAAAQAQAQEQQQQQYTAMYAALTEQIKDLKLQMINNNSNNAVIPASNAPALITEGSTGSRKPTPPVTPARRLSVPPSDSVDAQPETTTVAVRPSPVPSPKPATPAPAVATKPRPPTPMDEALTLANNPHGFKSMVECLEHIAALEANSHQALTVQLLKSQQRQTELTLRNAALEEELASYQSYMRDVVPQYKKQLQYLKQQLKMKMSSLAAVPKPSGAVASELMDMDAAEEKILKLPLIK